VRGGREGVGGRVDGKEGGRRKGVTGGGRNGKRGGRGGEGEGEGGEGAEGRVEAVPLLQRAGVLQKKTGPPRRPRTGEILVAAPENLKTVPDQYGSAGSGKKRTTKLRVASGSRANKELRQTRK